MIVVIDQPGPYYCKDDENHFFQWLYDLPAFENVRGTPAGLEISIRDPIDRDSMYRQIGLLKRYSVNLKPLKALCHPGIDEWLRGDLAYWHAEMFGHEVVDK